MSHSLLELLSKVKDLWFNLSFLHSKYSTLHRTIIPVRYILLKSINSLCEFNNYLYFSCTIYNYYYGIGNQIASRTESFTLATLLKNCERGCRMVSYFLEPVKGINWSMPSKRVKKWWNKELSCRYLSRTLKTSKISNLKLRRQVEWLPLPYQMASVLSRHIYLS